MSIPSRSNTNLTSPPACVTAPALDGFIDKQELATHLHITVRTVENWMQRGALPYVSRGLTGSVLHVAITRSFTTFRGTVSAVQGWDTWRLGVGF